MSKEEKILIVKGIITGLALYCLLVGGIIIISGGYYGN